MADIRLNLIADLGSFKSALAAAAAEARGTVAQVAVGIDIKAWQKELSEAKRRLRSSLSSTYTISLKLGPEAGLNKRLNSLRTKINRLLFEASKPVNFQIGVTEDLRSVSQLKKNLIAALKQTVTEVDGKKVVEKFSVPFKLKPDTDDAVKKVIAAFSDKEVSASFNLTPSSNSLRDSIKLVKETLTAALTAEDFKVEFNLGNPTSKSVTEAKNFIDAKFSSFRFSFDVEATPASINKALAAVQQGFNQSVKRRKDATAEDGYREVVSDVTVPFRLDPDVDGAQKALLAGFKGLRVPFVLDEPGNVAAIAAGIAKAIRAAIAAAGVIRPSADLSELIALNEELSRKQAHLAEVAQQFSATPLVPTVDVSGLERLGAAFDEVKAKAEAAIAAGAGVTDAVAAPAAAASGGNVAALRQLINTSGRGNGTLRRPGFDYVAGELGIAPDVIRKASSIDKLRPEMLKASEGIGEDTARGILKGLASGGGDVSKAATLLGKDALQSLKDFLEIRSPSRRSEDEIGKPFVEGIIKGILGAVGRVKGAVGKIGEALTGKGGIALDETARQINQQRLASIQTRLLAGMTVKPEKRDFQVRPEFLANNDPGRSGSLQDVFKPYGGYPSWAPIQSAIEKAITKPAAEASPKVAALTRELETAQAALQQITRTAANPNLNEQIRGQVGEAQKRAQDKLREIQGRIAVAQAMPGIPATAVDAATYEKPLLVGREVDPSLFSSTLARTPFGRQRQLSENRRLTAENAFATLGVSGTQFEKAADTSAQQKALATLGALQKAGTISAGDYARAQLQVRQATLDAALPFKGLTNSLKDLGRQMATAAQDVLLYGAAFQALSVVQQLPSRIYEAVKAQDAFSNTLKASLGTGDTYGQQLTFLTKLSEQYGMNLAESRQGLTKMFAAMRQAGNETQDINNLQESLAILGASFNLNPEQMDRISTALGQISSKGQLMAEELKGQLGDVLPGAVVQFAQAAGYTGPDAIAKFNKAMEGGEISGEKLKTVLRNWSEIVKRDFSSAAAQAGNSLQGMENRFANLTTRIYESFNGPLSEIAPRILAPLVANLEKTADALDVVFGTSSNRENKLKAQLAILQKAQQTGSAPKVGDTVGGKQVTAGNLLELGLKEGQAVDVEAIKSQTQQLNDQLGQTRSRLDDLKGDGSVQQLANDFRNAANSVKAFFEGVGTALAPLSGLLSVISAILRPLGALGSSAGALAGFLVAAIVQVRLGAGAIGALQAAFTGLTTVSTTSAAALATTRGQLSLVGAQAAGATVQVGALRAAWINLGGALKLTPWMLLFAVIGGVVGQISRFQEQQEETLKRQRSFEQALTLTPAQDGRYVTSLDRYGEAISKATDIQKQIQSAADSGDSDRVSVLEKQRDEILKQAAGYTVAKNKLNELSQAEQQRLVDTASERVQRLRAQDTALAGQEQDKRQSLNDARDILKENAFVRRLNPFNAIGDALNGAVNGDRFVNAANQARDAGKSLTDIGQKRKAIQEQINKAVKEEADLLEKTRRQQVDQNGQDAKRQLAQFFTGALGLSQDNIDKVVQQLQARLKTSTPGTKDFAQQVRAVELAKALAEDAGKSVLQKFTEASKVQADAARQVKQAELDAADVRRQGIKDALNDRLTGLSQESQQLLAKVEERKSKEIQIQNDIKKIQFEIADVQRRSWENQVKQAVLIQSIIENTQLPGLKPARDNGLLANVLANSRLVSAEAFESLVGRKEAKERLDASPALRRELYSRYLEQPGLAGLEPLDAITRLLTGLTPEQIKEAQQNYRKLYKDKYGSDYQTPDEARAAAQRRGPSLNQRVNANLKSLGEVDAFRSVKLENTSLGAEGRSLQIAQDAKQGVLDRLRNLRSPQAQFVIETLTGQQRESGLQAEEARLTRAIETAQTPQGKQNATVDLQKFKVYGSRIQSFRFDIQFLYKQLQELGNKDPVLSGEIRNAIKVLENQVALLLRENNKIDAIVTKDVDTKLITENTTRLSTLLKETFDNVATFKAQIANNVQSFAEEVKQRVDSLFPLGTDDDTQRIGTNLVKLSAALGRISSAASNIGTLRNQIQEGQTFRSAVLAGPNAIRAFQDNKSVADVFGGAEALSTIQGILKDLEKDSSVQTADQLRKRLTDAGKLSKDQIDFLVRIFDQLKQGSGSLSQGLEELLKTLRLAAAEAKQAALDQGLNTQNQNNQIAGIQLQAALGRISPEEAQVQQQEIQAGFAPGSSNPAVRQQLLESVRFGSSLEQQKGIVEQLRGGFQGLFTDVISGFDQAAQAGTSFWDAIRQAAANFFNSLGKYLLDLAAKQSADGILGFLGKLIPGLGGGGDTLGFFDGASFGGGGGLIPSGSSFGGLNTAGATFSAAAPGSFAIPGFTMANGGILPGGFRAFASGGIVSQPTLGLVGEGRFNEAVIPLPDGKSVPVQMTGGGQAVTTNITVNVNNGQMQSNSGAGGSDLSRKLEGAVKQVIANELRPGGLIGGRR